MELHTVFIELTARSGRYEDLGGQLWQEIATGYSLPDRYYHNLTHLEHLIRELEPCKPLIDDCDTLLYAIFYHDLIYAVQRQDNEEQSALLAVNRLAALGFDATRAERCRQHILATKAHRAGADPDTLLFADADLSILGQPAATYDCYYRQIRQEYIVYPDVLYIPGRIKVLNHFLGMSHIYKTPHFHTLYEQQARLNLERELALLQ